MKKTKKLLSVFLSAVMLLSVFTLTGTYAEDEFIEDEPVEEEKIFCKATLEDDFADDRVIVVLKNETSRLLLDYDKSSFPEIDCINVDDLTHYTKEILKDPTKNDGEMAQMLDIDKYHQILRIDLPVNSKENVLEVIHVLENRDDVICVSPDYLMHIESTEPDDEYYGDEDSGWAQDIISLPEAWDITTGSSSVVVGVLDTGIDGTHPDLINNIDASLCRSFLNGNDPENPPIDLDGHGTHVAGIIGAEGDNTIGVCGVCWNVTLVSLKVLGTGSAGVSKYIDAVDYAVEKNISILNMSLGGDSDVQGFKYAVANYPGLVVLSAGNNGSDNDVNAHYPANYNLCNTISVGASTSSDEKRTSSNYGATTVDLFAPGDSILSCYPTGKCINQSHTGTHVANGYHKKSGTSMAAPFVTGTAALIKSLRPDLTTEKIKELILYNVDKVDALDGMCVTGGRLNVYKALRAATEPETLTGDVNGDGYADMVLARKSGGNLALTVLKGTSSGTFSSPVTTTTTHSFNYTEPVSIGDFNGDGKSDVIVKWTSSTGARQFTIYLGTSSGTFGTGANLSSVRLDNVPRTCSNAFIADFDGDGCDDYIFHYKNNSNGKRTTIVYKGKNTSPYITDAVGYASQSTLEYKYNERVFTGDFNGDGRTDLLVHGDDQTSNHYTKIKIYIGTSNGTFNEAVVMTGTHVHRPDLYPAKFLVVDADGDGYDDLVVHYKGSNGKRKTLLYRGKSASPYIIDPSTTALSSTNNYVDTDPVFAGDVNGDGRSDIIVHWANASTKRQLLVYTANANGTYNTGVNFSSTHKHNPYSWATGLYVADVNGDGKDDFIVKWRKASGTTSVFVHLGSASGFTEAVTTTTSLAFFMG